MLVSQQLFAQIRASNLHTNILKYIWKQPGQHFQLFCEEVSLSICLDPHFVNIQEVQSEPALLLCLRFALWPGLKTSDPNILFC